MNKILLGLTGIGLFTFFSCSTNITEGVGVTDIEGNTPILQ